MAKKKLNITITRHYDKQLSVEDEIKLLRGCRRNKDGSRDQLIKVYFPYVAGIAKKYHNFFPQIEFDELLEEGNFGLLQAMKNFEENNNARFSTYAWFWILRAVQDHVSRALAFMKVPERMLRNIRKINKMVRQAAAENKQMSIDDMTSRLDMTLDELKDLINEQQRTSTPISLDQYISDDDQKLTLKDLIPDNEPRSQDVLEQLEGKNDISDIIGQLDVNEAKVIKWRFGFEDNKFHTLKEVGGKIGLSSQRVRDIEVLALLKLKKILIQKDS